MWHVPHAAGAARHVSELVHAAKYSFSAARGVLSAALVGEITFAIPLRHIQVSPTSGSDVMSMVAPRLQVTILR